MVDPRKRLSPYFLIPQKLSLFTSGGIMSGYFSDIMFLLLSYLIDIFSRSAFRVTSICSWGASYTVSSILILGILTPATLLGG